MIELSTLPPMHVAARHRRLCASFDDAGIESLLVTNLRNVRYLTGFTGSAALLVVRPDALTLVTDGRYRDQAREQTDRVGVPVTVAIGLTAGAQRAHVVDATEGVTRLGLEAEAVTWAQQRRYASEWFSERELVATEGLVEALRAVKDDGEIARIEAAATIADAALASLLEAVVVGANERALALELDTVMRRLGASEPSFETIVASGPNAAKPHARPGGRTLADGDLVVIDFGATVDGYRSDMTRTLMVGTPSAEARRMYDVVAEAQRAGVAAVGPGVEARAVDEACRSIIRDAGWGEAFLHGTGHGVGLDIHEAPRVSWASDATLAAGHVVTVEPGVYLPEHGGVRIEDTLVVTADGSRPLTRAPKP